MSYRSFKRLLGETSLERKCHFLFGTATLLLITGSFWWYAWKTENVAYDQMKPTGRLLVYHALQRHIEWRNAHPNTTEEEPNHLDDPELRQTLVPDELSFEGTIIPVKTSDPEETEILKKLRDSEGKEISETLAEQPNNYHFVTPIFIGKNCQGCHTTPDAQPAFLKKMEQKSGPIKGVASIKMSTRSIDNSIHVNRAVLITTAFVTAVLIMGGSYLIVRYIIVKPVKHLKHVSDAISAGELNIRSEIQTGDEFEDLSHAFNRMLRTLVSMQDQLRRVNGDLDRKVDELAQANLALYQSNQLKSDFLATMSHELRTPLNSILGFSDVLLSSNQLTEKQHRWVQNIRTSGEGLLNMINDILDLAKIEAGKMQIRIEEFSILDVCEGLLHMFRPLAEKKNIDLEGDIEPSVPVLRQDANKLQQILWNLLSNAVKFTPEGGRVVLKAESDGLHLILAVIDTGVGIAPEDQELVFEKFRQAGSALTREHQGTGLGLSIVRELAKLLGGDVGLQSELGRGSTFTVTLPLRLNQEPRLDFDLVRESPPPLPVNARLRSLPVESSPAAEGGVAR
jgi:signal transduction histidine kinase